MVNYCCVKDCGTNQKADPTLSFFSFPRERYRQIEWLQAIGRQDLADSRDVHIKQRICSRHFEHTAITYNYKSGNKLTRIANPTLFLPGSLDITANNAQPEPSNSQAPVPEHLPIFVPAPASQPVSATASQPVPATDVYIIVENTDHDNVHCNSCNDLIVGYRYKCLTCQEYDLCSKCDKFGAHDEHCLLKIPKPAKYRRIDELVKNFGKFLKTQNLTPNLEKYTSDDSSDDDNVPITRLKKYDGALELSEEVKAKIRDEVTNVLRFNHEKPEKKIKRPVKKSLEKYKKEKRQRQARIDKEVQTNPAVNAETSYDHEVVFADVNYGNVEPVDIKPMPVLTIEPLNNMRLNEDLSDFIILNP